MEMANGTENVSTMDRLRKPIKRYEL